MTPEEAEIRLNAALSRLKRLGSLRRSPTSNSHWASGGEVFPKNTILPGWITRLWRPVSK